MHGFAHRIVSAKRKGNIAYAATYACAGKILLYPTCCLDEIDGVIAMLFETRRDSQNVRIEDDVICREVRAFGQEIICPRADANLAVERVCLAAFIKSHHDDGCAMLPNQSSLSKKFLLTVL